MRARPCAHVQTPFSEGQQIARYQESDRRFKCVIATNPISIPAVRYGTCASPNSTRLRNGRVLELKAVLQRLFDWDRNIFPSCGVIKPRLNARSLTAGPRPLPDRSSSGQIVTMQAPELGMAITRLPPPKPSCYRRACRRSLLQRKMSPVIVVVTYVFTHQSVQMAFVEYDEHNSVFGDAIQGPILANGCLVRRSAGTHRERHTVAHRTS